MTLCRIGCIFTAASTTVFWCGGSAAADWRCSLADDVKRDLSAHVFFARRRSLDPESSTGYREDLVTQEVAHRECPHFLPEIIILRYDVDYEVSA
jgi:hypothetical protein